jgi:dienelactone hydrolase
LAALFLGPADRTPRTTVLMLAGSGGGFPDAAAARDLATSGYRVLSLAYVRNWQGQPAELSRPRILDVPLEYIFSAIDWLRSRQDVRPDRIVVMGESRGAELALLVGSYRPDVAGIIAFSPSELRWGAVLGGGAAWTLNGAALPYAQGTRDPSAPLREFTDVLDGPLEVRDAATIAVERIRGPILLISSRADDVWPSTRMADDIERRLREQRFPYRVDNLQFDDASHLLMGFGPGITESRTAQSVMHFGGTQSGTETARNVGWARAKQFLADL